jgi:hypothetical protein
MRCDVPVQQQLFSIILIELNQTDVAHDGVLALKQRYNS